MRNWTIGKRIIFGGGTLLAMLLLIVGIAIASLKHLRNTVDARIAQDTMPGAIYSGLINNYMEDGFARRPGGHARRAG
jgi:glucose uptake protein GlcU